ncbi:imidazoleglycerol-phosphate dehydratase HisB [Candidatus Thorarchaeota archaeon]|nr:MAG: imidazoleglycerol-phosphate dehydratase HisB [Candidatus Thorarchaeota archaeon]
MRTSKIERKTNETDIQVSVNLDGQGKAELELRPCFFKHILTSMIMYSGCDITIKAIGDLEHHIIEDVAISLGRALRESIGDYTKITRFGQAIIPMDDSLALVVIDICNRSFSVVDFHSKATRIEDTQLEDIIHFINSFAASIQSTIHVKVFYGENEHHKIEAVFKALGFSLRDALQLHEKELPALSTKGVL